MLNHRLLSSKSAHTGQLHCYPHVIEFKRAFLTDRYICIVMEYANGGDLSNYVQRAGGRLKEAAARWFFQQLILGIDYCHRKGVVNRDIKLENTLLQVLPNVNHPPLIKICDFGYSKAQGLSAPKSKVGTLAYMAPEVITSSKYNGNLSDVWSCAVMLYTMLCGQNPFEAPLDTGGLNALASIVGGQQLRANEIKALRILNALWRFPDEQLTGIILSTECRDLLSRVMVADPARRLSISDIQNHPWFIINLPQSALLMNEAYLSAVDYSGMQSEAEIHAMMEAVLSDKCDAPKHRHADSVTEGNSYMDDMIDATIAEET
ncbi:hypothetical protein CEUSTIGMA_g133.t1 [Chlamydomonas eustigma]|uniref:non-specific serine/threonine protein kinase n=1 Tax=Chlamydomonas eustigma TaxID=1157962 RepID=A0A250WPB4_9CHLO|nr:hypothetical protein CEUSTIGMA_g133.t1 [Chlamydomonas eustigma]|eukprot:GAX72677.1 hypothetical protein CEUSTIGMA_g133.t1 [Chlamydomonas eustigma]